MQILHFYPERGAKLNESAARSASWNDISLSQRHYVGKTARCLMVGLPCGQFQGDSSSDRCCKMRVMAALSRALPIIMLLRHARLASMARTLHAAAGVVLPTERLEDALSKHQGLWLT